MLLINTQWQVIILSLKEKPENLEKWSKVNFVIHHDLQWFIIDGYCCGKKDLLEVCVAVDLKKTEDTLLLNHCIVKGMFTVVHDVLCYEVSSLAESAPEAPEQSQPPLCLFTFFKSLALMLFPQQMTADRTALCTTDLWKICNILLQTLKDLSFLNK